MLAGRRRTAALALGAGIAATPCGVSVYGVPYAMAERAFEAAGMETLGFPTSQGGGVRDALHLFPAAVATAAGAPDRRVARPGAGRC